MAIDRRGWLGLLVFGGLVIVLAQTSHKQEARTTAATVADTTTKIQTPAEHIRHVIGLASCKPSKQRVATLIKRHSVPDEHLAALACRRIIIGMSGPEVISAWGRPQDINTTTGNYGRHEQWVWENSDGIPYQFAYFENGVLTTVQN